MLTTRPFTLILFMCICIVSLSTAGALLCHQSKNEECKELFSAPISLLGCLILSVCAFALFYVESSGHSTGR